MERKPGMKAQYFVVLLLLFASVAHGQNRPRKITTIEDAAGRPKTQQTRQANTEKQAVKKTSDEKDTTEVRVKDVVVSIEVTQATNDTSIVTSAVLRVSFDASFQTSEARCLQPWFQLQGQVQHADTTRSRIYGSRRPNHQEALNTNGGMPYCASPPS